MSTRTVNAADHRKAMTKARQELGDNVTILSTATEDDGSVTLVCSNEGASQHSDADAKTLTAAPEATTVPVVHQVPDQLRRAMANGVHGYGAVASGQPTGRLSSLVVRAGAAARFTSSAIRTGLRSLRRIPGATALPSPAPVFDAAMTAAATQQPAVLHIAGGKDQAEPEVNKMRDDLASMRRMIERELGNLATDRLRSSPARAKAMDLLSEFGCDRALSQAVATKVDTNTGEGILLPVVRALLSDCIPIADSSVLDAGGVVALVGPTGAGKTTTAAKLAAMYAERHSPRDVALITIDQQRAAAKEQLQAHGLRLGITVVEASSRKGLSEALKRLAGYPLIIVDTAGMSPKDKGLMNQISLLKASDRMRTLLVAPASSNARDLSDLVRVYASAQPDALVLTKVDETARLGGAISVAVKHKLPIAFTANGQNVPGNIASADRESIAARLDEIELDDQAHEERHAAA